MYDIDIVKLKEYILEEHHTITAFAKAAGLSRVYISNVLSGKREPGFKLKISLLRMGQENSGIFLPCKVTKKHKKREAHT